MGSSLALILLWYLIGILPCAVGVSLQDSHLGGCTSRERVFAIWETTSFAALLPPLAAPPPRSHPSNICAILSPVDEVGHLVLPGKFISTPTRGGCDNVVVVGFLSFGGADCP